MFKERGFGFIRAEDGREIFFHRTAVDGSKFKFLTEGQSVEFDVERPAGLSSQGTSCCACTFKNLITLSSRRKPFLFFCLCEMFPDTLFRKDFRKTKKYGNWELMGIGRNDRQGTRSSQERMESTRILNCKFKQYSKSTRNKDNEET